MKKAGTYFLFLMPLLVLFSCGPKRPEPAEVQSFMTELSLRLNTTKDYYLEFVRTLPEDDHIVPGNVLKSVHALAIKHIHEEAELIRQCKPFETDQPSKEKSEALKQAAIAIVDTYLDGATKELAEVTTILSEKSTMHSAEVKELMKAFELRLAPTYETYGKRQDALAKEFDITIY